MLSKITSWRHSKVLAFVLAVAVFLTAFYGLTPVISLAEATDAPVPQAEAVVGYWDGTKTDVATAFAGQDGKGGSAENPYEITNGTQLYAAITCGQELYFKVMNDLALQEDAAAAAQVAALKANPDGNKDGLYNWNNTTTFKGHLDGDFHTITGVFLDVSSSAYSTGRGFIGSVTGTASIKNIIIDSAFIQSNCYMGGIVGRVSGGTPVIDGCTIKNSYIKNNRPDNTEGANTVAGIVGMSAGGTGFTVSNCVSMNNTITQTTADNRAAGIIGDVCGGKPTLINCISIGNAVCKWQQQPTSYTNVFSTESGNTSAKDGSTVTVLTLDEMKGADVYNTMKLTPAYGWIVPNEDSVPVYVGGENVEKYEYVIPVWDKTHTVTVANLAGEGTVDKPYLISTGSELYAAVQDTSGYTFKILNDIKLQSDDAIAHLKAVSQETVELDTDTYKLNTWLNGNKFKGTLIGNNHTIYGLYINTSTTSTFHFGLIGESTGDVTVEGVHMEGAYVRSTKTGNSIAAGIIARIGGSSANVSIIGCSVRYSYFYGGTDTGAIAGAGYGAASCTVDKCVSSNNKIAGSKPGGVFASNWTAVAWTIKDSISIGYKAANATPNGSSTGTLSYTNTYSDKSSSGTDGTTVTVVVPEKLQGATAYDATKLTPAHGWVVENDNSFPIYVGAGNATNYEYVIPIWNGTTSLTVANLAGAGSDTDPYLISTGSELYAAVKDTSGSTFKIMNDIKLQSDAAIAHLKAVSQGTTLDTTTYTFNSWNTGHSFKGKLIGNNYTIYGLYTKASAAYCGLIGQTAGDITVEGLHIDSSYIHSTATGNSVAAGILARIATNGCKVNVTGCSVKYSYLYGGTDAAGLVGIGYAGGTAGTTCAIEKCVLSNSIIAGPSGKNRGGLYCSNWQTVDVTVKDSICVGYKVYHSGVTSITNTYSDVASTAGGTSATVATQAQLKGAEIPGIDATTGWEIKDGEYPKYTGVIGKHPVDTKVSWNGYTGFTDVTKLDGAGTLEDPYKIYYGYQLYAAVAHTGGSYFKLMNDIQLQSDANMVEIKKAIADDSTADTSTLNNWYYTDYTNGFKGHIDGNFKTVSGLYSNQQSRKNSTGISFISAAKGGSSIKNLTLDSAYLTGNDNIGGFIGMAYTGSGGFDITGCVLKNSKFHSTSTETGNQYATVAGYVGGYWSGGHIRILNSIIYDTTLLSDNNSVAGFTANDITNLASNPHAITNCISVGYVPSLTNTVCTNVYTDVNCNVSGVIANTSVDTLRGGELPGFNSTTGWDNTPGSYPKYVGYDKFEHPENTVVNWDGFKDFKDVDQLSGKGTVDEPYKIHYPFQLFGVLQNTTEGLYFEIMNDFYLNTEARNLDWNLWEYNKTFAGNLNGNGHTIYNMEEIFGQGADNSGANSKTGAIALIPAAQNATISNLHIRGTQMNDVWCSYTAGLVGVVKAGTVTVSGCSVNDSNIGSNVSTAAFVAKVDEGATVNVENCVTGTGTKLTKRGSGIASGIVALNNGTVNLNNCISAGYAFAAGEGSLVAGDNAFAIVSGGDYADAAALKAAIAEGTVTLSSDVFYYDALSNNLPMLKNRLATQNKDIDGDDDADLDADDALALKNILLYGYTDYLTLSADNANGYNDLEGVDITDLVALASKKN